jgi:hypothetical protein
MPTRRKAYRSAPLTGGLLNHDSRGKLKPKPLALSKSAPVDSLSESHRQAAFFSFVRQNAPRQPVRSRRKRGGGAAVEPDFGSEAYREYLADPLYVLTRIGHVPLGGHRHAAVAGQLREEGARRGMFDIILDYPSRGYHGARFEMKVLGGRLTPEQTEELWWLRRNDYFAHVPYTEAEAIALLLYYLDLPHTMFRNLPTRFAFNVLDEKGHDGRCPDCSLKLAYPWLVPKNSNFDSLEGD